MSSKSVKITNGKILNYKISASGYKTIYGSQVISSDTSITKNMLAENDPNGVYSFGDRIGNIATFVDYFNTTNPETNVDTKYAVFVLDAAYRTSSLFASNASGISIPNLPTYTESTSKTATESATFNCDCYLAVTSATWTQINNARNISITLGGNTYYAQMPTIPELLKIKDLGSQIDAKDPTVSDYSSMSAATFGGGTIGICASTGYKVSSTANGFLYFLKNVSNPTGSSFNATVYNFPVFEIPVE